MIHLSQGKTAEPRPDSPTSAGLPPFPRQRCSDRQVFSSILSLFRGGADRRRFCMQKRTRSVLSELRRTHNMHDWTLSGTDHPAVHFNVEQKGKGSSLCSTFFPSQQFFSFFFSMPLIKVFLIISYVPCFSEVPAFIDQDTQFTHETIPQKMTGNSSRLR